MKINPLAAFALGLALLVGGLVTQLITLDLAGAFVMFVAAARWVRDRRGSQDNGSRS